MGQVLYRKYRSKTLKEIVGQEHITTTLEHALANGTISHAYLFTGPRGVGKTSVARILAHEINNLPYTDESSHLDIIEIDAASNRRIDEIRDLRDKVHIMPTSAKYKVYIIDEVHMLTREAFNALLKTLEEPPAHIVFILATTEAYKLPETIISRTQRFTFRPVPIEKVATHLREIANTEKLKIDDNALQLIAEYGDGSFRDSISLLDQVRNQAGVVTSDDVRSMIGIASNAAIQEVIEAMAAHDAANVVRILNQLFDQGFEAEAVASQLGGYLRQQLLQNSSQFAPDLVLNLLKNLLDIPRSNNPKASLELALLATVFIEPSESSIKIEAQTATSPNKIQVADKNTVVKSQPKLKIDQQKAVIITAANENLWPQVLETIKLKHNTLYSVLRIAKPKFSGNQLELELAFAFHQKRLTEPKNTQILSDTIENLTGQKYSIVCVLRPDEKPTSNVSKDNYQDYTANNVASLETVSNIFGNVELLEGS